MNKFSVLLVVVCATCIFAELPSGGYSYAKRGGGGGGSSHGSSSFSSGSGFSSFGGSSGGGYSSGGGGYSSGGGGGYSSGHIGGGYSSGSGFGGGFGHSGSSGYQQVSVGHQTSEGAHVDQQLLYKIKEILIQQENLHGNSGFGGSGHGHGISSQYGVPQSSYGPPSFSSGRVVGIDFGHVQQGHQVAQYLKHEASAGHGYAPSQSYSAPVSSSYGLPSVSSSYSAPIQSYSAPVRQSYSAPSISSSYSAPAISRPSSGYGVPH